MKWVKMKIASVLHALLITGAAKCMGMVKVALVVGSTATFFSLSGIIVPLSGATSHGIFVATATLLLRFLFKYLTQGVGSYGATLAFLVPGFAASLYWASSRFVIRLLLPILCIVLFVVHPVGQQAALYASFWLIPGVCYFFFNEYMFATALGSTFTAHAVGSVIWLYTVPMVAEQWLALMPLVVIERLMYAAGMAMLYALASQSAALTSGLRAKVDRVFSQQQIASAE